MFIKRSSKPFSAVFACTRESQTLKAQKAQPKTENTQTTLANVESTKEVSAEVVEQPPILKPNKS
jgi:hypothetical protein